MNSTFSSCFSIDGTADDSRERKVFPKRFHTDKGRAGERMRTERENDSGALIKRNINQRDDMAMYKPLHSLLSRNASCFPSSGALSPHSFPSEYRPELLRMWVFLYAFLHVRFDSLSRRCEFFSLRRTPFFLPSLNERSSDNEEKHLAGRKCLKMRKWIYIDSCISLSALDAASWHTFSSTNRDK